MEKWLEIRTHTMALIDLVKNRNNVHPLSIAKEASCLLADLMELAEQFLLNRPTPMMASAMGLPAPMAFVGSADVQLMDDAICVKSLEQFLESLPQPVAKAVKAPHAKESAEKVVTPEMATIPWGLVIPIVLDLVRRFLK